MHHQNARLRYMLYVTCFGCVDCVHTGVLQCALFLLPGSYSSLMPQANQSHSYPVAYVPYALLNKGSDATSEWRSGKVSKILSVTCVTCKRSSRCWPGRPSSGNDRKWPGAWRRESLRSRAECCRTWASRGSSLSLAPETCWCPIGRRWRRGGKWCTPGLASWSRGTAWPRSDATPGEWILSGMWPAAWVTHWSPWLETRRKCSCCSGRRGYRTRRIRIVQSGTRRAGLRPVYCPCPCESAYPASCTQPRWWLSLSSSRCLSHWNAPPSLPTAHTGAFSPGQRRQSYWWWLPQVRIFQRRVLCWLLNSLLDVLISQNWIHWTCVFYVAAQCSSTWWKEFLQERKTGRSQKDVSGNRNCKKHFLFTASLLMTLAEKIGGKVIGFE